MPTQAEIYATMHERRFELIEERRRSRDYQAQLADAKDLHLALAESNAAILELVATHAERYSRGSVTRVALDTLALEIMERLAK